MKDTGALLAGVCLLAVVVGIWLDSNQQKLDRLAKAQAAAATQPTTQKATTSPSSVIDLSEGRQLKYLDTCGTTYAAVVFPEKYGNAESVSPYTYRRLARMLLMEHDKRQWWVDESREMKPQHLVYVFRLTTEEEYKRANELKKWLGENP